MKKKNVFLPMSAITLFFGVFMLLNSQLTATGAFIGTVTSSVGVVAGMFSLIVSGVTYVLSVQGEEEKENEFG
jgi:hypothetical protein